MKNSNDTIGNRTRDLSACSAVPQSTVSHRAPVQASSLICLFISFFGTTAPQWARASSFTRFLDHMQRRTTVGRTPLDEQSARRRDLYLTTHSTHNKHPCPRVGFEPTISADKWPHIYDLDCAGTGTGHFLCGRGGH